MVLFFFSYEQNMPCAFQSLKKPNVNSIFVSYPRTAMASRRCPKVKPFRTQWCGQFQTVLPRQHSRGMDNALKGLNMERH